jgi:hypothetical protein
MKGLFMQRFLLGVTLVLFGALTAVALGHHGFRGIFQTIFQSWAGVQVFVDLAIALSWCCSGCGAMPRPMQRKVWPWIVITLVAGSFGPLLYLLTRTTPARAAPRKSSRYRCGPTVRLMCC